MENVYKNNSPKNGQCQNIKNIKNLPSSNQPKQPLLSKFQERLDFWQSGNFI